jgi:uncharacterized protein YkwD
VISRRTPVLLSTVIGALLAVSLAAPPTTAAVPATGSSLASTTNGATASGSSRHGSSKRASRWERKIVRLTNARRDAHGCRELKVRGSLRKAARQHTRRMARHRTLSHQLPGEAGIVRRIERAGYRHWRAIAENIAVGQASPRRVVGAWMHSSTHRRNILNCGFRHIGVGVGFTHGRPWVTQDFGRR